MVCYTLLHVNDTFDGTSGKLLPVLKPLGKKDFLYGLIEVRAKMPHLGGGTWPAIWMVRR
jgi:hypothetical protein